MMSSKKPDLLAALVRAAESERVESYRRALCELLVERYPQDLNAWLWVAQLDSDDKRKVEVLANKIRELEGIALATPTSSETETMGIYIVASGNCADMFMKHGQFDSAVEFYERARRADPKLEGCLRWRAVAALVAMGRVKDAPLWSQATDSKVVFPLGDIANQALCDILNAPNSEKGREIFNGLAEHNRYLVEFLRGEKRIPATLPKRPKRIFQGSRYEALLYLEVAVRAWTSSSKALDVSLDRSSVPRLRGVGESTRGVMPAPTIADVRSVVSSFSFSRESLRARMSVVVNPALWAEFYSLAQQWWRKKVWTTVGKECAIQVLPIGFDDRFESKRPRLLSTMGDLGHSFGIHVFDSEDDFNAMARSSGRGRADFLRSRVGFSSVTFEYAPIAEVSEENRCLLRAFGVEPCGADKRVPEIRRYRAGFDSTLPVEGRLLELIYSMRVSLELHDDIVAGRNAWRDVPKGFTLSVGMDFPDVTRWGPKVETQESDSHPFGSRGILNQLDLHRHISRAFVTAEKWEVNWTYLENRVEGTLDHPSFAPVALVVAEQRSGSLLSVEQGLRGESLEQLLGKALTRAIGAAGRRPAWIVVPHNFACDALFPIFKATGVGVRADSSTAAADAALEGLLENLNHSTEARKLPIK